MNTEPKQQLLIFINTTDAPCITKSLRNVLKMAIYDNSNPICCKQKDDLYILEKIIDITEKI